MSEIIDTDDKTYLEMLAYFGSPKRMAKYFDCKIQAVYQWKDGVPKTRLREFNLIKALPLEDEDAA